MKTQIIYILSVVISAFGSIVIIAFGHRIGILDIPNHRSSHSKVVPKGGGVGILFAFLLSVWLLGLPVFIWGPALFLSLTSFWGDKINISPVIRLTIQFLCSAVFLFGLFYSRGSAVFLYVLIIPLSIFISGTANFYNFMDGIDGISGITGIVAFSLLWGFGTSLGVDQIYLSLCLVIVFSCLGFLPFNFPNAKVFMGDIGSILLGFLFACMTILMASKITDFVCMTGFLFLYYLDELTTMFVRIKDGESLTKAHRRHLYQILANEYQITHWKISTVYGLVQLCIGMSLFAVKDYHVGLLIGLMIFYAVCYIFVTIKVRPGCIRGHETRSEL